MNRFLRTMSEAATVFAASLLAVGLATQVPVVWGQVPPGGDDGQTPPTGDPGATPPKEDCLKKDCSQFTVPSGSVWCIGACSSTDRDPFYKCHPVTEDKTCTPNSATYGEHTCAYSCTPTIPYTTIIPCPAGDTLGNVKFPKCDDFVLGDPNKDHEPPVGGN